MPRRLCIKAGKEGEASMRQRAKPMIAGLVEAGPRVLEVMGCPLRAKLEACQPGSVAGFTFYNCGFMRYNTPDWPGSPGCPEPFNRTPSVAGSEASQSTRNRKEPGV